LIYSPRRWGQKDNQHVLTGSRILVAEQFFRQAQASKVAWAAARGRSMFLVNGIGLYHGLDSISIRQERYKTRLGVFQYILKRKIIGLEGNEKMEGRGQTGNEVKHSPGLD
jgi:hypothetical protein